MKTLNYNYNHNFEELKEFILDNHINKAKNVLLQIFCGKFHVESISLLIKNIKVIIPHINIIGATTSGEILDGKVYSHSSILSFSIFEKTTIKTYFVENEKDSYTNAQNLINQFDKEIKPKVAISFADGLHTDGELYLRAFHCYDKELLVAGGLAGDNALFDETIVFTQDKVLKNGSVVALLYSENLQASTQFNFGWESIGKTMIITKVKNNIVYEIDHTKAVDIYSKYLGKEIGENLPITGVEFPLILQDRDLLVARATIGLGEDKSLIFAGTLRKGERVKFGYGNINVILNGGEKIFQQMKKFPIESIFIYSCMARKELMGNEIEQELEPLNSIAPLCGFFTYGEFFSSIHHSTHELLNETMTMLTLSESKVVHGSLLRTEAFENRENSKTLKALSHLISQTSEELEQINHTLEQRIKIEVEKNQYQNKKMLEQSRLAQMGEMLSMIAHQWRQPLTAISATSSALNLKSKLNKLDNETVVSLTNKISLYAQHLSNTIDDFRDFFKSNKEKKEINYDELVSSVLNIVEISIVNKNIKIIKNLESKEYFFSYPNEIKQVILNLIKNAEDILVEKKINNPMITISSTKNILTIADNAGGIPFDIIERIFDPYFSTKLEKNGTGLGLYMSKTIIEEHCGGILSVTNNTSGAVFKIIIN